MPRNRTYLTVEGDTPASIAQSLYDDARLAAALMAYNGVEIAADVVLTPGGEVLVPQRAMLEREFARFIPEDVAPRAAEVVADARPSEVANETANARPSATRIYEVARGETVYDIARRELGRVSRWREILQLNQDQLGGDIDAVAPGMKLVLPEAGRSSIARQRGELLWR
jgi:nucleoid-associated protein YgaU